MDILLVILFVISKVLCESKEPAKQGVLWEYCQGKTFSPKCNTDEVIIMEQARYGHIQLGKCIDTDFGHLGCVIDQLSWFDKKCSGKMDCSVDINDDNIDGKLPCTAALVRYLEAKYTCQKVEIKYSSNLCEHEANVPVKSRTRYLSSTNIQSGGCGTETKPWKLQAKNGQKINMSITDFNWRGENEGPISHPCPVRYGYIIDTNLNEALDICGGTMRRKHLHLSKGSDVQIIINTDLLSENSFIISYQAIGCPTFTTPTDTWAKQEDNIITVGCNHNTKTWKMRCIGSNWIGIPENCETADVQRTEKARSSFDEKLLLGMPSAVTLTIFGGVFLVIVCVVITLLIGVFCIKNTRKHSQQNNGYYMTPISCDQTLDVRNTYPTFRPVYPDTTENNQSLLPVVGGNTVRRQQQHSLDNNHHYFVLEKEEQNKDSVYDVVYQNA